ncbi:hypothetical protein AVEN_150526-1 [Araneus ventricosus]|uniref:Uncharacterized protein n=1 Tax=Araneus ventricosus TaxID=182803 RepID=A0A4Y2E4Y9_ARAVE|nr:hypothetical protein AVEN_150526-1 [Araneus ventricosus]
MIPITNDVLMKFDAAMQYKNTKWNIASDLQVFSVLEMAQLANEVTPHKYGVSLKPSVWSDRLRKLCHFQSTKESCVLNHTANYNVCVSVQRLF